MKNVVVIAIPRWNVEEFCGYKPITTFWMDFSIADHYGTGAVKDTYKRAFNEWKDDYKYLTELVLVLNHKIWQWYKNDENLAEVYNDLYDEASRYAENNLKGQEARYYFHVTD